jgi:uncharacterized membrane protein
MDRIFMRSSRDERRLTPSAYKLLLTTHIIVAVGWLGAAAAKLLLGVTALTSAAPEVTQSLFMATQVLNVGFPPLAIGTFATGVLLSLGTRWGLVSHYWVVLKIAFGVGVVVSSITLSRAATPTMIVGLSVAHVLMLAIATIVSEYKPWGPIQVVGLKQLASAYHQLNEAKAR